MRLCFEATGALVMVRAGRSASATHPAPAKASGSAPPPPPPALPLRDENVLGRRSSMHFLASTPPRARLLVRFRGRCEKGCVQGVPDVRQESRAQERAAQRPGPECSTAHGALVPCPTPVASTQGAPCSPASTAAHLAARDCCAHRIRACSSSWRSAGGSRKNSRTHPPPPHPHTLSLSPMFSVPVDVLRLM